MVISMFKPWRKMGLRANRGSRLLRERKGAYDGIDKASEATALNEQRQSARIRHRDCIEVQQRYD